jgi:hypothetical protein
MRRLLPRDPKKPVVPDVPETYDEHAFVTAEEGTGWQEVGRTSTPGPGALVRGEEQLPLFSASYLQDDGRKRHLLAGLIPVGRHETYVGAPPLPLPTAEEERDPGQAPTVPGKPPFGPREILLRSQVIEPWKQLIERAEAFELIRKNSEADDEFDDDARKAVLKNAREQIQTGSWYVLLDFAKYLHEYMPLVWSALPTGQPPQGSLSTKEIELVTALRNTTMSAALEDDLLADLSAPPEVKPSLAQALIDTFPAQEQGLEAVTTPYVREAPDAAWPPFLFPLADPEEYRPTPPDRKPAPKPPLPPDNPATNPTRAVNELARLVDAALRPPNPGTKLPPRALAAQPVAGTGKPAWFVIRCVYERPRCGPLEPTVVSEPTRAFQLAGFFDPDAPARPIRIGLPIDTSPAGLRKFDKNTAFMISDILCGQMSVAKKLTLGDLVLSVLPWPFHRPLPKGQVAPCPDGMVCSFSIPHVTIVALLLLIIFATVLHAIFHWLPWFFTCFSLPGFNAKAKES